MALSGNASRSVLTPGSGGNLERYASQTPEARPLAPTLPLTPKRYASQLEGCYPCSIVGAVQGLPVRTSLLGQVPRARTLMGAGYYWWLFLIQHLEAGTRSLIPKPQVAYTHRAAASRIGKAPVSGPFAAPARPRATFCPRLQLLISDRV